ncbi:IclR family transcriptional regulator [Nonomuraea sp. NBC_01738]|uniref:IclR family transcriptional regulator n=1 Tax=Nonomuraea sp. NBC_01738 TaxID=2976003 RepID=UPI002E0F53BE|nr:IclR family transcriptional regulator [Nonomuraea sp. NBC_01738]
MAGAGQAPIIRGGVITIYQAPGSLEKGIKILKCLDSSLDPLSLARVSSMLGLPKTTVHRLLGVLCDQGLAKRVGLEYMAGDELMAMGAAWPRSAATRRLILPHLVALHGRTGQTVNLVMARGLEARYIERVYGHNRVRSRSDGLDRAPLHCTAAGKVLLSFSPTLRGMFLASGRLPQLTKATIVRRTVLINALKRVESTGVSYSHEEFTDGLSCVAAPIFEDGRVRMAVGLACSAPFARLADLADEVRRTADDLSADLSARTPMAARAVR